MPSKLGGLSLVNLFVEDLAVARSFYADVLGLEFAFGDHNALAFELGDTIINLLTVKAAIEQIAPAPVGAAGTGSRVQLAIVVTDIDDWCRHLEEVGVPIINGPQDQSWGVRTACFADPFGHNWELAQPIGE